MAKVNWKFKLKKKDINEISTSGAKASVAKRFPPGYSTVARTGSAAASVSADAATAASQRLLQLKTSRSWAMAQSPGKSVLMTLFMAWMAGSSVNIFSIMITGYLLYPPIVSMMGVNKAFEPFAAEPQPVKSLTVQKIVYVLMNMGVLAIGMYKLNSLGLLPTTDAEWAQKIEMQPNVKASVSGTTFQI